jgi:hypothetical protein
MATNNSKLSPWPKQEVMKAYGKLGGKTPRIRNLTTLCRWMLCLTFLAAVIPEVKAPDWTRTDCGWRQCGRGDQEQTVDGGSVDTVAKNRLWMEPVWARWPRTDCGWRQCGHGGQEQTVDGDSVDMVAKNRLCMETVWTWWPRTDCAWRQCGHGGQEQTVDGDSVGTVTKNRLCMETAWTWWSRKDCGWR